ncbi:MAG: hypothetical protein ACT4NL_15460 [Pseudomarimonas sp.]
MNMSISNADNVLLRAWRRNELDPVAADALETRLFFEPDLLAAAQSDQHLTSALAGGSSAHAPSGAAQIAATQIAAKAVPLSSRQPWSLLLAAGLGALAVLPFASQGPTPAAVGNIEWVSVDVRRGSESEALLVAPRATASLVVIEIPAPANISGPYTLSLVAAAGSERPIVLSGLHATDGLLSLAIPRDALAGGDYRIEVATAEGVVPGEALQLRYQPQMRGQ